MRSLVIWLAVFVALTPAATRAGQPADCTPVEQSDGWAVATPEREGLDPAVICGIAGRLEGWTEADPHGVMVVRNGTIVYERYFAGQDWRMSVPLGVMTFDADTKHDMRSISKSVVSLLIGIALDRGLLNDLDAPMFSFFPEYASLRSPEKDRITLRHLLTMSSGLAWDEVSQPYTKPANSYYQMAVAADSRRYVLERPLAATPGETFNYNSGTADLLGLILRRVSGKPLDAFAKEVLFEPLGITDWDWDSSAAFTPSASAGLRLRPRDLAKIGQLVLQHGAWQNRQIVSSQWIEQSIMPRLTGEALMFNGPEQISSYGYLWWLGRLSADRASADLIAAAGDGGQRLFIIPSLNLVIVTTAGAYGSKSARLTGAAMLKDYVLPSVLSK